MGSVSNGTEVMKVVSFLLSWPKYGDIRNYSRNEAIDIMYKYYADYFAFMPRIQKLKKKESLFETEQYELAKIIIDLNNINMNVQNLYSSSDRNLLR